MRRLGWPGVAALLYAVASFAVALVGNLPEGGYHFWPFAVIGLVVVGFAAIRTGQRWLWLLALPVLAPMAQIIFLMIAYLFGFRLSWV